MKWIDYPLEDRRWAVEQALAHNAVDPQEVADYLLQVLYGHWTPPPHPPQDSTVVEQIRDWKQARGL